jgi:hypothetical protein
MTDRAIDEVCQVGHPLVAEAPTELDYEQSKKNGSPSTGDSSNSQTRIEKDGKKRTPNSGRTFTMCGRCSRIGKPSCQKCMLKKNEGKMPVRKGQKPKKFGDPLFDWQAFDTAYDVIARSIDEVANCYKDKGPEFHGLHRLMREFRKSWDAWRKKLLKANENRELSSEHAPSDAGRT